jgi:hypothetical protein
MERVVLIMSEFKEERRYDGVTVTFLEKISDDLHEVRQEIRDHVKWEESVSTVNHKRSDFVDMLIERETKRNKVRDAIIEKTITGLVWAMVVFVGVAVVTYIKGYLKWV